MLPVFVAAPSILPVAVSTVSRRRVWQSTFPFMVTTGGRGRIRTFALFLAGTIGRDAVEVLEVVWAGTALATETGTALANEAGTALATGAVTVGPATFCIVLTWAGKTPLPDEKNPPGLLATWPPWAEELKPGTETETVLPTCMTDFWNSGLATAVKGTLYNWRPSLAHVACATLFTCALASATALGSKAEELAPFAPPPIGTATCTCAMECGARLSCTELTTLVQGKTGLGTIVGGPSESGWANVTLDVVFVRLVGGCFEPGFFTALTDTLTGFINVFDCRLPRPPLVGEGALRFVIPPGCLVVAGGPWERSCTKVV